jgi:hypothetical protein
MAQNLIDFGDLGGEKGAALQMCERRQVRIVRQQTAEFLPGGLWLNVGEIALGEFSAANPSQPPQRGGGPGG